MSFAIVFSHNMHRNYSSTDDSLNSHFHFKAITGGGNGLGLSCMQYAHSLAIATCMFMMCTGFGCKCHATLCMHVSV